MRGQPSARAHPSRRTLVSGLLLLLLALQLLGPLLERLSHPAGDGAQRVWVCTLQGLQALLLDTDGQPIEPDANPTTPLPPEQCSLFQLAQLLSTPLLLWFSPPPAMQPGPVPPVLNPSRIVDRPTYGNAPIRAPPPATA